MACNRVPTKVPDAPRAYGVAIRRPGPLVPLTITNTTPKNGGVKVWRDGSAALSAASRQVSMIAGVTNLLVALWRLLLLRPVLHFGWLLPDGEGMYVLERSQASMYFRGRLSRPLSRERGRPAAGAPDEPAGFREVVAHFALGARRFTVFSVLIASRAQKGGSVHRSLPMASRTSRANCRARRPRPAWVPARRTDSAVAVASERVIFSTSVPSSQVHQPQQHRYDTTDHPSSGPGSGITEGTSCTRLRYGSLYRCP